MVSIALTASCLTPLLLRMASEAVLSDWIASAERASCGPTANVRGLAMGQESSGGNGKSGSSLKEHQSVL